MISFPDLAQFRRLIPTWRYAAFASVLFLLVLGFLFVGNPGGNLSARAVLEDAEKKKLNWQFQPGKVLYWEEEEHLQNSDQKYISKRWSNNLGTAHQWVSIRFDEQGKVVFGKWIRPDGQIVEYRASEKTFVINPTNSQMREALPKLNDEQRGVLTRYLESAERKTTPDQISGLHTSWFLKYIANQSLSNGIGSNGQNVVNVRLKSDVADSDPNLNSTELEASYEKDSLQRSYWKITLNKKDGTSTFEDARLILAREATLEEFENNDLAKLLASQQVKYVSVGEFAERIKAFYPPKPNRQ